MKKIFCVALFSLSYLLGCQAQFFFGPTVGINEYFIHFNPQSDDYHNFSKISVNYGLKTEMWFTKYLFLSTIHRISNNNHKIKNDVPDPSAPYYDANKFKHYQNSLLINGSFNNNIAVGFGVNQIHNYALSSRSKGGSWGPKDTTYIDKNFKFNQLGGILSFSKAISTFVFEMNYSFVSSSIRKPLKMFTHALQINVSYLFKTNFKFSKKGLDYPRF